MGGSGGSIGSRWKPSETARQVQETQQKADNESFRTELAQFLGDLLKQFNDRDSDKIQSRLADIIDHLKGSLAERIDQNFGGSVAKSTYLEGLSDVDCLLVMDRMDLENAGPKAMIAKLRDILAKSLGAEAKVSAGEMAVTVSYKDGMDIQLLPAARDGDRLKIPSTRVPDQWSSVRPRNFHDALTKHNADCAGQLVPTIKLAKAIIAAQLPDAKQLSGYHVESLAIDAFKNYKGTKTTAAMLPHFFEHAKGRVLQPMTDSTGQSVHVDEYMGGKNSTARTNVSHILDRLAKRVTNASAANSITQWKALFGDDQ